MITFDDMKRGILAEAQKKYFEIEPRLELADCWFQWDEKVDKAVVNQIIMLLVVEWFKANPQFQFTLNNYAKHRLDTNNQSYDSQLKSYQRSKGYLKTEHSKMLMRLQETMVVLNIEPPDLFEMESKHKGTSMSQVNLEIISNHTSDSEVANMLKTIESGKMADAQKVNSKKFVQLVREYEDWVAQKTKAAKDADSDVDFLIHSIDFFDLQKTLHIDLIFHIAEYMEREGKKDFDIDKSGYFWFSILGMEPNQVLYLEQAIPWIFLDDHEWEKKATRAFEIRRIQAATFNYAKENDYQSCLTVDNAAEFVREDYNVLQAHRPVDFGTAREPKKALIKLARKVMRGMYDPRVFNTP